MIAERQLGAGIPETAGEIVTSPWSSADDAHLFDVHESATGRLLARVRGAGEAEVDAALADARRVFEESWRLVSPGERAALLRRCAAVVREHADEIAAIETREVGKPYSVSRHNDVEVCIASFEYFAGLAQDLHGGFYSGGPVDTYTIAEPYGVVVGIIPFNWPPIHTGAKVGPALAAGNVVVLKPPEQCPFTVARIVELLQTVLPEGVLRVVPGVGATAGDALVSSPRTDKISFTGSPGTARHVLRSAAEPLTSALLELGGKNPFVVFPDADLDVVVPTAVEATFFNSGEACTSASRLVVHASIADAFAERYTALVASLGVGDPFAPTTRIGAMITRAHRDRVLSYVEKGVAEGAVLRHRGDAPEDPELAGGYWVAPVVFDHVEADMTIAQEEIFGPVASILRFTDYDDAVRIANSTDFALVASVWTDDALLQRRAARDIDAGVVFVNNYNRAFIPTPFGGNRASGHGREHSAETVREYLRSKSVRTPSGLVPIAPRWTF